MHNLLLLEQEVWDCAQHTLEPSVDPETVRMSKVLDGAQERELADLYHRAGVGAHEAHEMVRELVAASQAQKRLPGR